MKKETINTFEKGMVKDLHPLTTPNNLLTDALNATFITYNGNENILQNDMGNVEVGTAFLPKGYVPVGMKEYGGVIYVAAYNPETKKGLIGSFPSPLQLWEGNPKWTVNAPESYTTNVTFPNNFYNGNYIESEVILCEIFTNNAGIAREFHPGDKFAITCNNSEILNYKEAGYIKILLAVVRSDGAIEVLKTMEKGNGVNFFSATGTIDLTCQVFTGSSSGKLLIIITINTPESFNLIREYRSTNNSTIEVKFIGEAIIDGKKIKTTDTNTEGKECVKLFDGFDESFNNSTVTRSGSEETLNFTIAPHLPYGIIKRMEREIHINFKDIRKNKNDFHEWRFFVKPNKYIKIGWAYEFYNLDGDKEIEYMKMNFYDFDKPNDYPSSPIETLVIDKEYYSGNFEEYLTFDKLQYKHIYIVEISQKLKGENNLEVVAYKMLYTSTLYNSQYNNIISNENALFSAISVNPAELLYSYTTDTKLISLKFNLKTPKDLDFQQTEKTRLKRSDYIVFEHEVPESEDPGQFITKITNKYESTLNLKANITYDNDQIIGIPDPNLTISALNATDVNSVEDIFNRDQWYEVSEIDTLDDSDIPHYNDVHLLETVINNRVTTDASQDNPVRSISKIETTDIRYILGEVSDVKKSSYSSIGYKPYFLLKMSHELKNRIAPFWDFSNTRVISGNGDEFFYNTYLQGDGNTIPGSVVEGIGVDDPALDAANRLMNLTYPATVNIFAGSGGKSALLEYEDRDKTSGKYIDFNSIGLWRKTAPKVDGLDDFLITCWKTVDGVSRFANLLTPRYLLDKASWQTTSNSAFTRLDIMLRSILSQLFVALRVDKVARYITTNSNYYRYLDGLSKLKFNITTNSIQNTSDIICNDTGTKLSYLFNMWTLKISTTNSDLPEKALLVSLIPTVSLNILNLPSFDVELEDKFNIEDLLTYYMGLEYTAEDNFSEEIGLIKAVDTEKLEQVSAYCENGVLLARRDGTFEWADDIPDDLLVSINGDAKLLRWDYGSSNATITINRFSDAFITKAAYENWISLGDDFNEILATDNTGRLGRTNGMWEYRGNHAPDMFIGTLNITDYSLFKITSIS